MKRFKVQRDRSSRMRIHAPGSDGGLARYIGAHPLRPIGVGADPGHNTIGWGSPFPSTGTANSPVFD